jgi:outer membrane protein assembly factor BamD
MKPLVILALSLFLCACTSSETFDTNTPEGAFKLGEKFQKDSRFEEALVQFNKVKNKFPYSNLAVEAKLKIADIHFEREEYPEAQAAYQVFKELHPNNAKADYATYQLAMSFYKQLPATIDRDLSIASRAILYFDEVLSTYPNSQYAPKARQGKSDTLKMLAEKEYYVGHFYFIRDHYEAALGRFEDLLRKYPGLGFDKEALYHAAVCAYRVKDYPKAKDYYSRLIRQYGKSSEAEAARKGLDGKL